MFLESTVHLKQLAYICIIELTGSCILHRAWYTRYKEHKEPRQATFGLLLRLGEAREHHNLT